MKHILIVDDSNDLQSLLAKVFKSEGYIVSQAMDGEQAFKMLQTATPLPSAILLDIMMPVMDGLEFKSKLNEDKKFSGIPVVWMSADANSLKKAEALGGEIYIQKPIVNLSALISKIETLL